MQGDSNVPKHVFSNLGMQKMIISKVWSFICGWPKFEMSCDVNPLMSHPSLISKMCYKMFDELQKWSWYTKEKCKCQCVGYMCTVGVKIIFINICSFSFQIKLKIPI